MSNVTVTQLANDLRTSCGVEAGDTLIVHSSLSSIGRVEGGAATVIRALIQVIGPSGTLLMPAFSDPRPDGLFHMASTPGRTGLISETLRTWPGSIRSRHPTHSVVANGRRACEYTREHERTGPLGAGSPFHRAALAGAKVLLIGCDLTTCSLVHVAESLVRVPYLGKVCYPGYGRTLTLVDTEGSREVFPPRDVPGDSVRFGIVGSALFAVVTTAASCGAVNAMHDSFTALGGMIPLINMQLGEIIIGGVGAGLYGMLLMAIITVFIAGLMVGRTPEYLGKKIEMFEIKMAAFAILIVNALVKVGTAIAVTTKAGVAGPANPGPHGFSEILYAFSSAANNNGSAFAGLSGNTFFYNTALGIAMFFGRFWVIIPVLAIAGSLAGKKQAPASLGTLPTHTPLFVALLTGVIVIVGALSFMPAWALGPIAEWLTAGR